MRPSFEREYYESTKLWVPERYGDLEYQRSHMIIKRIPPDVETLLDVGCGNGFLTNQLNHINLVAGTDRSTSALKCLKTPACQSSIDALPFKDNSFDLVLSTEVIEHLTSIIFKQALDEIIRVARRYILITVPYREQYSYSLINCPACDFQFHPNYHMRRFDYIDLERLFKTYGSVKPVIVEGIIPKESFILISSLEFFSRKIFKQRNYFPSFALCPHCGYTYSTKNGNNGKNGGKNGGKNRAGLMKLVKRIVRPIWPKRKTYCWWLALYEKR
jgi:SAM-dependent methyltransferase